jgi:hypothetical protein
MPDSSRPPRRRRGLRRSATFGFTVRLSLAIAAPSSSSATAASSPPRRSRRTPAPCSWPRPRSRARPAPTSSRRDIEDETVLDDIRTIDETVPRDIATMIQGAQGYGLGRPSPTVPRPGASLGEPAPSAA